MVLDRLWLSRVLLPAVGCAAVLAIGGWVNMLSPPWPSYGEIAAATFIWGLVAFLVVRKIYGAHEQTKVARAGGRWLFVALVTLVLYFVLWVALTRLIGKEGTRSRVIIGFGYNEHIEEYRRLRQARDFVPPMDEILDRFEYDPDQVFEPLSLALARALLLAAWFGAIAAVAGFFSVWPLSWQRAEDPLVARVSARIEGWPPEAPADVRSEIREALRTLALTGNIRGAIVALSSLFEGASGLLARMAEAGNQRLKEGTLESRIEELNRQGIVTGKQYSDLHNIRIRANKARHKDQPVTVDDAHIVMTQTVAFVEWYLADFEHGPHLKLNELPA